MTAVPIFCGGRGAASLARAFLAQPDVRLSMIVNGYDNGLSTGALRRFVPGMLGVSDFRKNLRHHLSPADPHEAALLRLLDLRVPTSALASVAAALRGDEDLRPDVRSRLADDLDRFEAYRGGSFELADCSVGNLVVAGAYLRLGRDFNRAVADVAATVGCPARLLNVSDGRNAFLVAVKEDGSLLADEAEIVAPQSAARIRHVFLLPSPLAPGEPTSLAELRARAIEVPLAPDAAAAISAADLLVYGPGTHHSSLLPTFLTAGLGACVRESRARVKVMVMNVRRDHDALAMDAADLFDSTLHALGDPANTGSITHVVHQHRRSADAPGVPPEIEATGGYRGSRWIAADVEHGVHSGVHDGRRTAALLGSLLAGATRAERA